MKKQFQSKSVPRGTRTLWRYLGALFILFTLGIGQMWAAEIFSWTVSSAVAKDATVDATGGTVTCTGSAMGSETPSSSGYFKFNSSTQLTFTLSSGTFAAGDVISFNFTSGGNNKTVGVEIQETSPVTQLTETVATKGTSVTKTYTVAASDGIQGQNKFSIKRVDSNFSFKSVSVTRSGGDTPVCPSGLTISSKDSKTAFTEGDKIELTAALAKGNGTITYQWYKGSVAPANAISGATNAKYEVASCTTADAGDYFCVASKDDCSDAVNASAFAITVAAAPVIEPTGTATITYALSGSTTTGTVTGVNSISGLSSSLTLSTLTLSGTKDGYSGGIKNCSGTTELVEADYVDVQFTVGSGYVFTPSAVTVQVNPFNATGALKAVVKVMDAQPLEVASEERACAKNTDNAVTFASGAFTNKKFEGMVHLRMYFYGAASDKTFYLKSPISIIGTVDVKPSPAAPSISAPDADQAAVYDLNDEIAALTITASGYPTPTYQWYKNSSASTEGATAIEGAQSASYTPANNVASDSYYYCVATNSQGSATSHYFHVTVNAPAVPTIYTETTGMTLASNKVATASDKFTFTGANLDETAVTLVLASEVDGLTLSKSSVTPTAGAIAATEVTVSYKSLLDVAEATVDLYIKQGETTLKTIVLTYSSTAGIVDLTSISAATTWNWKDANSSTGAVESYDANNIIVLANHSGWVAAFDANSISGKLQYVTRDGKYAQGEQLKFNTTVPGKVYITYSNTGGNAARTVNVNGTKGSLSSDGTSDEKKKTENFSVAAGDVLIKGVQVSDDAEKMLRYYKVEFKPTYTVSYAANGGEGDMTDANAYVAGDEVTLLANTFTPAGGFIWSGWAVTKTASGDPIEVSEGKFTMPAEAVTVTAQWEDNSKVAKIGDNKYTSLEEALEHAADGTIELLQDIDVTAQVEVEAGVTAVIDLAGHKIEYTGTETLPSGVILVHNGASLTINDSSDPNAGSIVAGEKAYAAIAMTKAGDAATNPAVLVINGGIFTGYYYGITGNGSRPNTQITINGGTITATATNDNLGIYHPQDGTLTVNGGTITAYASAIEMRAGTLVINGGTFTATAPAFSCNPNGSGTTTVGAAIAIAQHTTKTDISVTIKGGTFEGEKAINESNPQANDPAPQVDLAVTGGDFTGEVSTVDVDHFISGGTYDAPVTNENCAEGFVPSPLNPVTGKYSVEPKDGTSLIKAVATAKSQDIEGANLTGVFKGAAHIETSDDYKMDTKKYFMVQLVAGQNFQAGDIVKINVSAVNDCNGFTIYSDIESDGNFIPANLIIDTHDGTGAAAKVSAGINEVKLPEAFAGSNKLYVGRASGADKYLNAGINQVEVTRAMNPQLLAITIDGRDGVINEAAKTVAVQIPYEADLAALAVVPTIAWNAAAAENSIVVNNGGAWIEGANTYKLTDKDNDYTVYTITLTRDVLKHAVKFYDGETLLETLEVEDDTSIAVGDVPADPEKEDYIFQGWAETAGGDVVEVTSFTISAAKNFYAKWVSDGAIKLLNGTTVDHEHFITGVSASKVTISSVEYNCVAFTGTVGSSVASSNIKDLTRFIAYNATKENTRLQVTAYNTNGSKRTIYVKGVVEGTTEEVALATIELTGNQQKTTEWIEFNNEKNRTIYIFMSSSATDVKFLQVKVVETGDELKMAGKAGYSINLNKGRWFGAKQTDLSFEGMGYNLSSDYTTLSSTAAKLKSSSFVFDVTAPVTLQVTSSDNKTYYVTKGSAGTDNPTAKNGLSEFDLTVGKWYITAGSSEAPFTKIAFIAPRCQKPTITTQPATKQTFDPGNLTATVVATVSDGGTLKYQWYNASNDEEVEGATEATLTTTTEGTYYVIVTNTLADHSDNFIKSAEATLGYRVTNDATLMALSYGGTAITLEDGVYNYNVELAKGTTDVPALAATATMDGYADVDINDAAEFVNYEASSTVTVKSEDLTETNVYTVNFYVKHDLPQVDVTASTVWDMNNVSASEINLASMTPSKQNVLLLLANIEGVNNNASFNSQALMFEGQRIGRTEDNVKYVSGQYVQFNVTVPGMVSVTFASNGSAQRTILINGKQCSRTTNDGTYIKYDVAVEPGSVEIEDVQGYVRISKIEFKAEDNYHRTVNPSFLGTLCWTNNAVLGGATLYEFAGKNENNYLVFDEVEENRLEAGKPYIFMPENGNTEIKVYNTDNEDALTEDQDPVNNMYGTITGKTLVPGVDDNMYYFSSNHIWAVKDFNVNIPVPAYYCYVDYAAVLAAEPAPAPAPGRRRVTMGVNGKGTATGIDAINASEKPMKLIIDGQMFILRGQKMFDVTGKLVK